MALDSVLLVLLIFALYRGWKKGLLWAIVSIIASLTGILLSLKFSHQLAAYLLEKNWITHQYTVLICFLFIFIFIIFIFKTLTKLIESFLDSILLGWMNRASGALLYMFIILFICSTFLWLLHKTQLLNKKMQNDSKTYSFVEPIAPKTIEMCTPYLPYFKTYYQDINTYFDKINIPTKK